MSSHERAHHDEANNVTYQRCQFAYEFAKVFLVCELMIDFPCADYCKQLAHEFEKPCWDVPSTLWPDPPTCFCAFQQ